MTETGLGGTQHPPASLRWMRFVFGRCISSAAEVRLPMAAEVCSHNFLRCRQWLNPLANPKAHQTGQRRQHLCSMSSRERCIAQMTAAIFPSRNALEKSMPPESSTAINSRCACWGTTVSFASPRLFGSGLDGTEPECEGSTGRSISGDVGHAGAATAPGHLPVGVVG
jgi:hypothetical protein